MSRLNIIKRAILVEVMLIMLAVSVNGMVVQIRETSTDGSEKKAKEEKEEKEFIKWLDFTPTCEALSEAYRIDVETYGKNNHVDWISLLALTASKTGGEFNKKSMRVLKDMADKIAKGETTVEKEAKDLKLYSFYKEAYDAVLSGMVGEFEIETADESGKKSWTKKYGLKSFTPIAKGFEYSDYDDFGSSRSFGYRRKHLGHDMMGQIGTPVIAIESGVVEAIGWNRYGGWRIGIRSFDKKRYYYYAHLRQNYPYQSNLKEGSVVTAGDVIGYMGHTGYSDKENVNNIKVTHLHWGLQIIFDESQKDSDNEIWIDCYQLTKFLYKNRCETYKKEGTKEWDRVFDMKDPKTIAK